MNKENCPLKLVDEIIQTYMSCVKKGPTDSGIRTKGNIRVEIVLILFRECDDYVHQMLTLTDTTILSYNLSMRFVFLLELKLMFSVIKITVCPLYR